MTASISWLHFSDIHFRTDDANDRNVVLSSLLEDVEKLVTRSGSPNFIAVTGDIAYHGLATEYELATMYFFDPLLKITKVPKNRFFLIPGNHDVNRARRSHIKFPLASTNFVTRTQINSLCEDSGLRDVLLMAFADYDAFVRDYLGSNAPPCPSLGFETSWIIDDASLSVIGVNTAWLSGFTKGGRRDVDEYGRLVLGEHTLRTYLDKTLSGAPASDKFRVRVLMMHHPTNWLAEPDRVAIEQLIEKHRCVMLRGHLHRPDVFAVRGSVGTFLEIPAGAVFDGRNSPLGYNSVHVNAQTGYGEIEYRTYSDRRGEWVKDLNTTGEGADGKITVALPSGPAGERQAVMALTWRFSEKALAAMHLLKIDVAELKDRVVQEFTGHKSYLRFDFADYPLPVRGSLIVVLDKVEDNLQILDAIKCTNNEKLLADWNGLLAGYRRLTRLGYRQDPQRLAFMVATAASVLSLHLQLLNECLNYLIGTDKFAAASFIGLGKREAARIYKTRGSSKGKAIVYRMREAQAALREAHSVVEDVEKGLLTIDAALSPLVTCFERSLQHFHKLLLENPPIDAQKGKRLK